MVQKGNKDMYQIIQEILNIPEGIEYGETVLAVCSGVFLLYGCKIIFKFIYKLVEH